MQVVSILINLFDQILSNKAVNKQSINGLLYKQKIWIQWLAIFCGDRQTYFANCKFTGVLLYYVTFKTPTYFAK